LSEEGPADAWRRRFERERLARKEAESLLSAKSRELFEANRSLEERARDLASSLEQLHAAQDALVQREKMAALGALVAGIAHEINTPLGVAMTAVTYGLERLGALRGAAEAGQLTRGQVRALIGELGEALGLVRDNLERGAGLVRSFKMVAVDQSSEEARLVRLDDLLGDVIASLSPMLRKAGVSVAIEGRPRALYRVAAGPLVQVITNLLQNACVHAFRGASGGHRMTLSLEEDETALLLRVADNGVGMPPEVAARVFDPFFTTRRSEGGSGLGMNIVYNIVVSRFGGAIEVDSEPGLGTTWRISLPIGTAALAREDRGDGFPE
jgi:signal transduction histidine kinase